MRRAPAAAALVVVLLSGCGSTVQVTGSSDLGQGTADGLGQPLAAATRARGAPVTTTDGTSTTAGRTGAVTGSTAPGTTTAGGPVVQGGSGGQPVRPLPVGAAPGVTATTIAIGLPVTVNGKAAAAAIGASGDGVGGGDERAQWKVVLDDVNDHGGLLGRKVVPVYWEHDATDQTPIDQQENQACATYTQDNKVFAVVQQEATPGESLQACLAKAHVAQVYEDLTRADTSTFQRYPAYLEAGTLQMDRVAALWPGELARVGYFSPWSTTTASAGGAAPVKVGIISFDDPSTQRAVEKYLRPALKAVGHPDDVWVQIHYPTSTADNGGSISAIQSAALKMASEGITHVLPFDSQGAGIGGFFAVGADSQKYYPRYGLNSGVGAQTLHDAGVWPTSQLHGSVGFGWVPLLDLPFSDNPDTGPYSNDARRRCVKLMTAAGQAMSSAIVERQAIGKCDAFSLLAQALARSGTPTVAGLVSGVDALGTSFTSGLTFATSFDRDHHDGAAAVRSFAFDEACTCMRYTGPTRRTAS